jgi:NAD(P)-dependent dehydrogenase (short-subunit alcohol dehydrogenase family)
LTLIGLQAEEAYMKHLALVTGAAKRVGRAIALRLADAGCDIAIHHNASAQAAKEVTSLIQAMGRRAHAVAFDQRDDAGIARGLAEIEGVFGSTPDVLVNSASIAQIDFFENTSRQSLAVHFDVNVAGPVLLAQRFAAGLGTERKGLIINLTDHKLFNPNADHFAYTISKHALQSATDLLARKLAPRIRVCAIAPGHVLPGPGESLAHFEAIHSDTLLEIGASPEDVAEAAAYLLASPTLTGQTIIVDAGEHLRPRMGDQTLMQLPED